MQNLSEYLPILIPLVVVQLSLSLFALIHVLRHPMYRYGNKVMWSVIVLLLSFIGPILYLTTGRGEA